MITEMDVVTSLALSAIDYELYEPDVRHDKSKCSFVRFHKGRHLLLERRGNFSPFDFDYLEQRRFVVKGE